MIAKTMPETINGTMTRVRSGSGQAAVHGEKSSSSTVINGQAPSMTQSAKRTRGGARCLGDSRASAERRADGRDVDGRGAAGCAGEGCADRADVCPRAQDDGDAVRCGDGCGNADPVDDEDGCEDADPVGDDGCGGKEDGCGDERSWPMTAPPGRNDNRNGSFRFYK